MTIAANYNALWSDNNYDVTPAAEITANALEVISTTTTVPDVAIGDYSGHQLASQEAKELPSSQLTHLSRKLHLRCHNLIVNSSSSSQLPLQEKKQEICLSLNSKSILFLS